MNEYIDETVVATIAGLIGCYIVLCILYWNSSMVNYKIFNNFPFVISAISQFLLAAAVIFQIGAFRLRDKESSVEVYAKIHSDLIASVVELFREKPGMDYMYRDLMGLKKINGDTKRNLLEEHKICFMVFAKLASPTLYIDLLNTSVASEKLKKALHHITDTYMKSEIFREFYVKEYKPKLVGPAVKKYMMDRYGL